MALPFFRDLNTNDKAYNSLLVRPKLLCSQETTFLKIFYAAYVDSMTNQHKTNSPGDFLIGDNGSNITNLLLVLTIVPSVQPNQNTNSQKKNLSQNILNILKLFAGIRTTSPSSTTNKTYFSITHTLNQISQSILTIAHNTIKLFTEFPVCLIDYSIEYVFENALHNYNYSDIEQKPFKVIGFGLLTALLAIIHVPTKIASLLVRLTISYNKTCLEADAFGQALKLSWLGPMARVIGIILRIAICLSLPFTLPSAALAIVNQFSPFLYTYGSFILASIAGAGTVISNTIYTGPLITNTSTTLKTTLDNSSETHTKSSVSAKNSIVIDISDREATSPPLSLEGKIGLKLNDKSILNYEIYNAFFKLVENKSLKPNITNSDITQAEKLVKSINDSTSDVEYGDDIIQYLIDEGYVTKTGLTKNS